MKDHKSEVLAQICEKYSSRIYIILACAWEDQVFVKANM